MRIVIDLDGTICDERPTFERALAKPLPGAAESIKFFKNRGDIIIIYTARSWAEYELTKEWLKCYEIPYDVLLMGKPVYDLWIDDRAISFEDWEGYIKDE